MIRGLSKRLRGIGLAGLVLLFTFLVAGAPAGAQGALPPASYDPNADVAPHLVVLAKQRLLMLTGRADEARRLPVPNAFGLPNRGSVKVLVLPIQFKGHDPSATTGAISARMFGSGGTFPYESVANYYDRSSRHLLDMSGTVLPWYKAPYKRSTVTTRESQEATIREAIAYWDARGRSFSQYDNNGDGRIDYIVVVWTGDHGDWGGLWWPHFTYMQDPSSVDGKTIAAYSSQTMSGGGWGTPRVTIHETGHALGLPDLYDPEETDGIGPKGGVGGLDMMDMNSGDLNGYFKFLLGWNRPTVVRWGDDQTVELRAAEIYPDAILACVNGEYDSPYSEFYLIEKRLQLGNDADAPGEGIAVWHVDGALNESGSGFAFNNQDTEHKLVRLMEADGREHIERGYPWWDRSYWRSIKVTAADYYNAGGVLGPSTVPSTQRYDGDPSGLQVSVGSTTRGKTRVRVRQAVPRGDTRISLTWGEAPVDLDSHLTGPLSDGSRFHIYYSQMGDPTYATLDHDDIDSYGPETITITSQTPGVYRYSVHDFTDRWSDFSTSLASSGAVVRVYRSTGLIRTFVVPPDSAGTLWTVFEMEGTTITPINSMSYEYYPEYVWSPPNGADEQQPAGEKE